MDFLSKSDPYVKLSLGGDMLPAKKTTVKMNSLDPVWDEDFKLTVKDPEAQVLQLHLYDWEKVRILIWFIMVSWHHIGVSNFLL